MLAKFVAGLLLGFIKMKVITLVALALCAVVHASIPSENELGDSVKGRLGPQKLHLHAGSDVFPAEDQRLAEELAGQEQVQGRSMVASAIASFLESFRNVVINGNDVLPPLDPLQIPQIGPVSLAATGVRIEATLNNFNLEGLRWYVVDHVTFYALRLALGMRVTVPWIIATGKYDASARIGFLSHNAGGDYRVFINRLQTSVDIRVGTNIFGGGTLILRELDIDIVIHDVTVQISGMVGSSVLNSLINTLVQNAAQNLLLEEMEMISQRLSRELFDAVNEFLGNFTLEDLLS